MSPTPQARLAWLQYAIRNSQYTPTASLMALYAERDALQAELGGFYPAPSHK